MLQILGYLSNFMAVIGVIAIVFYVVVHFLASKFGQNLFMTLIYIVALGIPVFILYHLGSGFIQGISGK
jgi:hypothetical protein